MLFDNQNNVKKLLDKHNKELVNLNGKLKKSNETVEILTTKCEENKNKINELNNILNEVTYFVK
jgi:hypothetical protein